MWPLGKRRSRRGDAAAADSHHPSLPPGWVELRTPEGHPYYENPNRQATQWVHPVGEPLPRQWRVKVTADGQPYYLNDATRKSQWEHPCTYPGDAARIDAPPPMEWEVEVETGWYAFPPDANRAVAEAQAEGKSTVPIGSHRVVDLKRMVQYRTDTGRVRRIRACGPAVAAAAMDLGIDLSSPGGVDSIIGAGDAITPAVAPAVGRYAATWEVQTDQGWIRYSPKNEAMLTAAYLDQSAVMFLTSGRYPYVINLARFTQRRADMQSKVRAIRATRTDNGAAMKPLLPSRELASWQVKGDKGWITYEPDVADAITLGRKHGLPSVAFSLGSGRKYVVDVANMTQTPALGGVKRQIRGPLKP